MFGLSGEHTLYKELLVMLNTSCVTFKHVTSTYLSSSLCSVPATHTCSQSVISRLISYLFWLSVHLCAVVVKYFGCHSFIFYSTFYWILESLCSAVPAYHTAENVWDASVVIDIPKAVFDLLYWNRSLWT